MADRTSINAGASNAGASNANRRAQTETETEARRGGSDAAKHSTGRKKNKQRKQRASAEQPGHEGPKQEQEGKNASKFINKVYRGKRKNKVAGQLDLTVQGRLFSCSSFPREILT